MNADELEGEFELKSTEANNLGTTSNFAGSGKVAVKTTNKFDIGG